MTLMVIWYSGALAKVISGAGRPVPEYGTGLTRTVNKISSAVQPRGKTERQISKILFICYDIV